MLATCASTVLRAIDSRSPMAWSERPSAIQRQDLALPKQVAGGALLLNPRRRAYAQHVCF